MTQEEFFEALDNGLFNLTALAKLIGITNPTMYSKANSKKFKQWELDKLIDAGIIVPENVLKEWGDKNQLLLVTGEYDNLRDIVTRIQLFLLEMDMDYGFEAIRRAIYSPNLFQNRFYFSLKLSDKYEG
jgi:hypothetical protein